MMLQLYDELLHEYICRWIILWITLIDELLYACLCWNNMMILWCCNYMMNYYMNVYMLMNYNMNCICWINLMNIYEIIILELYVVVDVVVDVLRCCWCCQCCWCRKVVEVVRCCWVHEYSYKVGGSCPVEY